jgi:hypothetical protein
LVKQFTASGTSIGLGGRWTFEVTDMPALCLAVGASALTREAFMQQVAAGSLMGMAAVKVVLETAASILTRQGALPPSAVTTDDKVIRAAITARTSPLRGAPGLRIYREMSARRRGG